MLEISGELSDRLTEYAEQNGESVEMLLTHWLNANSSTTQPNITLPFEIYLKRLHEIGLELAHLESLDVLCHQAVLHGRKTLGFDRIALFLIDDDRQMVGGTYGTDPQGHVRPEYDNIESLHTQSLWFQEMIDSHQRAMLVHDIGLFDHQQIVGKGWYAIAALWDGDRAIGYLAVDNLIRQCPPRPYEEELLSLYGHTIGYLVSRRQTLNDLEHSERERIKLAIEHERSMILNRFIRDASHEFKTPLSVVNTRAFLIRKLSESRRICEMAEAIEVQTAHITRLINDMLVLSRLDGDLSPERQPNPLHPLIDAAVWHHHCLITSKQIDVQVNIPHDLPLVAYAPDELEEAMNRIIGNAAQYTPEGGKIIIQVAHNTQQMIITVRDTGIGIESQHLGRILERFYRVDDAHSTRGFGLGLAIAERAIDRHEGTIQINSLPEIGTTVEVRLPIYKAATREDVVPLVVPRFAAHSISHSP